MKINVADKWFLKRIEFKMTSISISKKRSQISIFIQLSNIAINCVEVYEKIFKNAMLYNFKNFQMKNNISLKPKRL